MKDFGLERKADKGILSKVFFPGKQDLSTNGGEIRATFYNLKEPMNKTMQTKSISQ